MDFQTFLQQFVNALSLGSLYALIAIGYTMVYGILRLINFAHGDVFMIGGYLAFYGVSTFFMPWWLAVAVAIALTTLFGVGLERAAYRPLRDSPRISIMISAIGASFLIENLAIVLFDARPKAFPVPAFFSQNLMFGGVRVSMVSLVIPLVTALILAVLLWIVHRTKTGMAMRAVSTDIDAARLMAIDVNKIVSITFAIGSALAAIGAVLYCMAYPLVSPTMGSLPGLKAFIAAVFGGIGILPGAMIGGFVMGIAESLTKSYISSQMSDAVVYGILIIMLLVKPTGLLGKRASEKV